MALATSSLTVAFFSPTGTTRRVLEAIAAGTGLPVADRRDLTRPGWRLPGPVAGQSLLLVGAPVYGGRVAPEAMRRLAGLRPAHSGGLAVPVVVYGNRHYDDALRELADFVAEAGFAPIAGAAFVGEHSFATAHHPIALSRPDDADLTVAAEFGRRIAAAAAAAPVPSPRPDLPGARPYKALRPRTSYLPLDVDPAKCQGCRACAEACPVGAIGEDVALSARESACTAMRASRRARQAPGRYQVSRRWPSGWPRTAGSGGSQRCSARRADALGSP